MVRVRRPGIAQPAADGRRELVFSRKTVLVRDAKWTFVRRSDGTVATELDTNADGCIGSDGRFVTWDEGELVRIDLGDPGAAAIRLRDGHAAEIVRGL